jgi:hypothetical protein
MFYCIVLFCLCIILWISQAVLYTHNAYKARTGANVSGGDTLSVLGEKGVHVEVVRVVMPIILLFGMRRYSKLRRVTTTSGTFSHTGTWQRPIIQERTSHY